MNALRSYRMRLSALVGFSFICSRVPKSRAVAVKGRKKVHRWWIRSSRPTSKKKIPQEGGGGLRLNRKSPRCSAAESDRIASKKVLQSKNPTESPRKSPKIVPLSTDSKRHKSELEKQRCRSAQYPESASWIFKKSPHLHQSSIKNPARSQRIA